MKYPQALLDRGREGEYCRLVAKTKENQLNIYE